MNYSLKLNVFNILFLALIGIFSITSCESLTGDGDGNGNGDGDGGGIEAWTDNSKVFVAVGRPGFGVGSSDDAIITISKDGGFTFEQVFLNHDFGLNAVAYGNGRFVAVGPDRGIVYSDDGENWTVATNMPEIVDDLRGVAYGDGLWLAVGNSSTQIYSTDGINWEKFTNPDDTVFNSYFDVDETTGIGVTHFYGLRFIDGKFYAVGSRHRVTVYSTDGTKPIFESNTNLLQDNPASHVDDIAFGNGAWAVVGPSIDHWSTDGGNTWNDKAFGWKQFWALVYAQDVFVAAYGFSDAPMFYSEDGSTWTPATGEYGGLARGLTHGNGRFVAVGNGGSIGVSEDGKEWTETSENVSATLPNYKSVAYGAL